MRVKYLDCTAKWYTQGKIYKVLGKDEDSVTVVDDWNELNTMQNEDFEEVEDTMTDFRREEKYIVLKIANLSKREYQEVKETYPLAVTEAVVVESDWPEYEKVWEMIEERVYEEPAKIMVKKPLKLEHHKCYFDTKFGKKIWLNYKSSDLVWFGLDSEGVEHLVYTKDLIEVTE